MSKLAIYLHPSRIIGATLGDGAAEIGAALRLILSELGDSQRPRRMTRGALECAASIRPFITTRRPNTRRQLSSTQRANIFARDGEVCVYCDGVSGPFEVDHILAVARGGSDLPSNLCVACEDCNRSKGAKLVSEWAS